MRVKTFMFEVTNWSSRAFDDDKNTQSFRESKAKLKSAEEIDEEVNHFCDSVKVADIQTSVLHQQYHNNGRGNTMILVYTILYSEIESEG